TFLRFAVLPQPEREPDKPERSEDHKRTAPTTANHQPGNQWSSDRRCDVPSGVKDCGGKATFLYWIPLPDNLPSHGKCSHLSDPEEQTSQTHGGEAGDPSSEHCCRRPNGDSKRTDSTRPDSIQ